MCDTAGDVIEATQANLFVAHDGVLATPALDGCGVAGVVRAGLITAAGESGTECRIRPLSRRAVETADEAFLCNSVIGIWPIRAIGTGALAAPGPLTRRARSWLETFDG